MLSPLETVMKDNLGEEWFTLLQEEVNKPYFAQIAVGLSAARKVKTIYPDAPDVFKAFKFTKPDDVQVIILGQDPYYNGKADGLAFSYKDGVPGKDKGSLDVIFEEIEDNVKFGLYLDQNYNLRWLAEQGVLLLNTILTVEKGLPKSHKGKGWENFTNTVLQKMLEWKIPKVFMIWGSDARASIQNIFTLLNTKESDYLHLFLYAPHPASDLYKRDQFGNVVPNYPDTFRGCQHFKKADEFLKQYYRNPILW